jgi:hypothetical protein
MFEQQNKFNWKSGGQGDLVRLKIDEALTLGRNPHGCGFRGACRDAGGTDPTGWRNNE